MRNLAIILTFILVNSISFGQTFVGTSTNLYNCTIRINKDSTVNFIYDRDNNGVYGEHIGTIKRINDTLFHISATMTIGQFYMKSFEEDTLYIAIDNTVALELDKISIIYSNKTQKHFAGYDKQGQPIDLLKYRLTKNYLTSIKGQTLLQLSSTEKTFCQTNF